MSGAAAATPAVPTTENCRFCWMCRQACPVGFVTARETFTPHAWALTIESVKRGQLTWNAETVGVMYACADCGLCRAHCVTDQPLPDAIVEARRAIVHQGAAPAAVTALDSKLKAHANPYASVRPVPSTTRGSVALFVGDVAHYRQRSSVDAAIALLHAAGIPVVPVGQGRSSGLVASSVGLHDTAIALARETLAEIQSTGATEILVLNPGDRWTFEYAYPTRLGVAWPSDLRVREATEVLAASAASGRLTFSTIDEPPVAYHDPCHAARIARADDAPRALLRTVLGSRPLLELFWRERRAHPCGAIGGLDIVNSELAASLAASRFDDAASVGAGIIVTEDPGCVAHLAAYAPAGMRAVGLFDLLLQAVSR